MKTIAFFLTIIGVIYAGPIMQGPIMEVIKAQMPCGLPEHGIPRLSPLDLGSFDFTWNSHGEILRISAQDITLSGLETFDLTKLLVDYIHNEVHVGIIVRNLTLSSNTQIRTNASSVTARYVYGLEDYTIDGRFQIRNESSNGSIAAVARVSIDAGAREFRTLLVGNNTVTVNGQQITAAVEQRVKGAFRKHADAVAETIVSFGQPFINNLLAKHSIKDLSSLSALSDAFRFQKCLPNH